MKRLILVGFALLVAHAAIAQESKRLEGRLVERSGWTVPIFCDVESKSLPSMTKIIDGIEVQVRKHELAEEQLVKIEDCSPAYRAQDFAIKDYFSYLANGHTFAYQLAFDFVYVEEGVITTRAAASLGRFYVDEDGDGTFEMRCNEKELYKLPKWLKSTVAS
jgi:hypothetical protein